MTATLLKHEWLRTRGLLGALAGIGLLVTALGMALGASGWPGLSQLGLVIGAVAIAAFAPGLQLVLAADYYRSSYARTGYFTHSLPIRGGRIYAAKLTWATVVTIAALLVTVVLAGIFWQVAATTLELERDVLTVVADLWETLSAVASPGMLAIGVLAFLAMYLMWPIQYFFAVSIGAERPLSGWGLGGPVLAFVVLYLVGQVLSLAGMFVFPIGIGTVDGSLGVTSYSLIEQMRLGETRTTDIMPIGFLPALLLLTAVCLWRTVRSWNHKISLV